MPTSDGSLLAALTQRRANDAHAGDPALYTADFADDTPGNLRVDYVLPSDSFEIVDAGCSGRRSNEERAALVIVEPLASSDHRLVWVDLR